MEKRGICNWNLAKCFLLFCFLQMIDGHTCQEVQPDKSFPPLKALDSPLIHLWVAPEQTTQTLVFLSCNISWLLDSQIVCGLYRKPRLELSPNPVLRNKSHPAPISAPEELEDYVTQTHKSSVSSCRVQWKPNTLLICTQENVSMVRSAAAALSRLHSLPWLSHLKKVYREWHTVSFPSKKNLLIILIPYVF